MSFDITTGKEPIKIEVFDRSDIGRDSSLGEALVSLDILRDQYKHDEWFDLVNRQRALTGKIRLNLHWIHSRKKFLQDILRI